MLPRLFIFAGRFGSGKTECAVNFAVQLAQGRYPTATGWTQTPPSFNSHPRLVDLDIVTPYFRTRELGETLRPMGIVVVSPAEVGRYLDLPAISPEILGAIEARAPWVSTAPISKSRITSSTSSSIPIARSQARQRGSRPPFGKWSAHRGSASRLW